MNNTFSNDRFKRRVISESKSCLKVMVVTIEVLFSYVLPYHVTPAPTPLTIVTAATASTGKGERERERQADRQKTRRSSTRASH